MQRRILGIVLAGLVQVAAGCTMCDNPHDYTGPVVDSPSFHPGYDGHAGHAHAPALMNEGQMMPIEEGQWDENISPAPPQPAMGSAPRTRTADRSVMKGGSR